MNLAQWRLLGELHREPGQTQSCLARRQEMDKVAAGRNIEKLEALGLLRRTSDPMDARARRVYPTTKLETIYRDVEKVLSITEESAFGVLSEREMTSLISLLTRVVGSLQDK